MAEHLERRRAAWTIALLPAAWTCALIAGGAVDVPTYDDWDLLPLLLRAREGSLSAGDLWAPHNEHRLVLPRLLMLALAELSRWDVRLPILASLTCAAATLLVLVRQHDATARALELRPAPAAPALALVVFSFAQWQNWLWGWQVQIFMSVLASVAGLAVLSAPGLGWARLAGGGALGLASTLSFASGLLFWPAAALVLWADAPGDRVAAPVRRGTVAVAALALVAVYLPGLPGGPVSTSVPVRPLVLATYVGAFLGAPVTPGAATEVAFRYVGVLWPEPARSVVPVAAAAGVVGCAAAAWLLAGLSRDAGPEARRRLRFWAALVALACGAAVLCGLGRRWHALGPAQALESRYVTFSSLVWAAVVGLSLLRLRREDGPRRHAGLAPLGLTLVLVGVCSWRAGAMAAAWRHAHTARAAGLAAGDLGVLPALAPHVPLDEARRRAEALRRDGLSLFRPR